MSTPHTPDFSPSFFLGVTPSAPLAARVLAWQAALEHVVTAPHVTVRGPGVRPERFAACEAACRGISPLDLRLSGVGTFGERVIFLRVGESAALSALHRALVEAAADAPGPHDLDGYHPHLTLALSWRRMAVPWARARASGQQVFGELDELTPVRSVTLYRKQRPGEPYFPQAEWPLGG